MFERLSTSMRSSGLKVDVDIDGLGWEGEEEKFRSRRSSIFRAGGSELEPSTPENVEGGLCCRLQPDDSEYDVGHARGVLGS